MWAENIIKNCVRVRPGESVLVITDEALNGMSTRLVEEALKHAPAEVWTYTVPQISRPLLGFPPALLNTAAMTDVVLLFHGWLDLENEMRRALELAQAVKQARRGRMGAGFFITPEILDREFGADYEAIAMHTERMAAELADRHEMRLSTPAGTDLTLSTAAGRSFTDTGLIHRAGQLGSLPGGMCCVAPLARSASGVVVIDRALNGVLVPTPLRVTVESGRVVEVRGEGQAADHLRRLHADGAGRDQPLLVTEVGIGMNPHAQLRGNITTDDKVMGMAHVTLGRDANLACRAFGVPVAAKGILGAPTLVVDGQTLIARGEHLV